MSPPALSSLPGHTKAQELHKSIGQGVFSPQTPGKLFSLEGQGSTIYTLTSTGGFGPHHLLSGQGDGLRRQGDKDKVPSMVPHLVFLPRILLPLTWYSWSLPTTANGIIS